MRYLCTLPLLLVASVSLAGPINPYAPTPGWTPPVDTWSQPTPVQPLPPSSLCDAFNPYWTTDCHVEALRLAPPPVDDEHLHVARFAAFTAFVPPQEEAQDVPEPALLLLVAAGLLVVRRRRCP